MDLSKSVAGAAALSLACVFVLSSAFAGEPDGQVRKETVVSTALAGEPDDQARKETVSFQDLNLDATVGVDALYKRIHAAAERVCGVSGEPKLAAASASAKCSEDAKARAIEKINLPALTAFAANR
jgi:UrcA family protein